MSTRHQSILYLVIICFMLQSSLSHGETHLTAEALNQVNATHHSNSIHRRTDAAFPWYSSPTEGKQETLISRRAVYIDPQEDDDRFDSSSGAGRSEDAAYSINETLAAGVNGSDSFALTGSEEGAPEEDINNNDDQFKAGSGERTPLVCADGKANNGTCTVSNQTCNDGLPCNATKEEYMQFLYDYMYPKTSEWILIFLHCIVFITGLVGNALVCVAVYTNYSMRTVTNVFIVNLAVADFLVILVCLPPSVVWDVTETWFLGQSMCKIVVYFQAVSITVSVLTLTFISVDRWYAICFPLRYRTKISRAIASVSFIWIVALASDVPEFLALQLKKPDLRYETVLYTQCGTTWDLRTEMNFYLAQLVLLYILPLLMMMIAYFKIVRILWKSDTIPGHRESRTHHQYSCGYLRGSSTMVNTSTMGQLRARRKAAKMLVAVVVMFATCYFPVHVFNLLRYTGNLQGGEITTILSLCSHWLCYANSAVNPVIYNFMSGKFRREFRNALDKCRCGRVRVEDRTFNQSNPTSRLHNISPSTRSNYNLTSVRDITITRDLSRQTMQTTFVENGGNGHSATTPMLNSNKEL